MNNFINLKTFSGGNEFPTYCALYLPEGKPKESLFSLTPDVMQWSNNIWLLHLEPCKSYWRMQEHKSGKGLDEIFHQVIKQSFSGNYLCAFANHPWQALFFLTALKRRKVHGLYFLHSLLNKRIYKNISWQDWFEPMELLAKHLKTLKAKGFEPSYFRGQQNKLKRFIQRANLKGPFDLNQAEESAMSRRFSSMIGKIWKWTFEGFREENNNKQKDLFAWSEQQSDLSGFPWINFVPKHPPQVSRHLEYPISLWDNVEPLIKEDLEKLCQLKSWSSHEKLLTLHWEIHLYSEEKVVVEISFRHPHALHKEASTGFKTALYQAYYSYMGLMNQFKEREENLDLPEEIPFLSWQLKVARRLYQNPQVLQLIPQKVDGMDYEKILDLQNKLSLNLEHYEVQPDFLPEQSFNAKKSKAYEFSLHQWKLSACKRPLFFYKKPRAIERPFLPRFLERISRNWWEVRDLNEMHRDYFVSKIDRQLFWIYRDSQGKWFKHGLYS